MVGIYKVGLKRIASSGAIGALAVGLFCFGPTAETVWGQNSPRGRYSTRQRTTGTPQTRYVAQNSAPEADRAAGEGVLKAYPFRPDGAEAMASRLTEEFRARRDVRIRLDLRTSQILVVAPPAVQAQIKATIDAASRLAPPIPPQDSATRQAPIQQPPTQPTDTRSRSVTLKNVSGRQLDADLVRMLGNRLVDMPAAQAGVRNYRLNLPQGTSLRLAVDERANRVHVEGKQSDVDAFVRLIDALDAGRPSADSATRVMTLESASPEAVRRAIGAIQSGTAPTSQPGDDTSGSPPSGRMVSMLFQQGNQEKAPSTIPGEPDSETDEPAVEVPKGDGSLIGPVQIEMLEGMDVMVLKGHQRDVEQVMKIIEEIEQLSVETEPAVEIYTLQHTNSAALAALLGPLYEEVFSPRQGTVSITALVKPNSLLLVGRPESVQTVIDLVKKLDQPVAPETQFRVFRLSHASAWTAQQTVEQFFGGQPAGDFEQQGPGLKPRVLATADFRSNSLIVRAGPRDMVEVAELIRQIDTAKGETSNELRVFKLENSLAEDLEPILQRAINDQTTGRMGGMRGGAGGIGSTPQGAAIPGGGGLGASGGSMGYEQKANMLTFHTDDRELKSGILLDVRITADPRANALIVSAPKNSMELIAAVIKQLDQLPAAQTQIKVFTIANSDAQELLNMLETLFGQQAATTAEPLMRTSALEGESSLVPLRFAVDVRTNSIIASGSLGDLSVVEAILLRLDDAEVRHRRNEVYLLKNAPATDVAAAITEFLATEQSVLQSTPGVLGVFEQIEREVVVVAEPVRNALLISATQQYYEEVMDLVMRLDEQPPMVVIQVLLAEVQLDNFQEFGVELGLQDSILFDRSLAGVPGFLFNNMQLGNDTSAPSEHTGGQALSSFGVGRTNSQFGYGGLVLSASSESVSVLIRALRECRRLEVLSRPQIMTLDNQPAQIQVGQVVSRIVGASQSNISSQTNIQVEDVDVGLILGVVPRITPEGLVVMEIRATNSELGDESDGTPISVTDTGETLRSPPINITTAETTVATPDGQTVVLGGLITKTKASSRRRIPFLSDIPVVRQLFRYDGDAVERTELLIIMTPHVVRGREDAERIKQVEAARMHWCLGDVIDLHGEIGLGGEGDLWADSETTVIYPDTDPHASNVPLEIIEPGEVPMRSRMVPIPEQEWDEGEFVEPPTPERSSGAGQSVPHAMPTVNPSPLRPVEQTRYSAPYSAPPNWGGVETAVYRDPRRQRDTRLNAQSGVYSQEISPDAEPSPVVPSAYQSPPVRRLPPVVAAESKRTPNPYARTNPVRQERYNVLRAN